MYHDEGRPAPSRERRGIARKERTVASTQQVLQHFTRTEEVNELRTGLERETAELTALRERKERLATTSPT